MTCDDCLRLVSKPFRSRFISSLGYQIQRFDKKRPLRIFAMDDEEEQSHSRTVLALVLRYLSDAGFHRSCATVEMEAHLPLEQVMR